MLCYKIIFIIYSGSSIQSVYEIGFSFHYMTKIWNADPVYKIIDKGVLWYFYRQIHSYSNTYYNFFGPGFSWPRLRVKETPEQGQGHIFIVNTTASPERKSGISRILWPLLYAAISIKGPSTDANCLPLNW